MSVGKTAQLTGLLVALVLFALLLALLVLFALVLFALLFALLVLFRLLSFEDELSSQDANARIAMVRTIRKRVVIVSFSFSPTIPYFFKNTYFVITLSAAALALRVGLALRGLPTAPFIQRSGVRRPCTRIRSISFPRTFPWMCCSIWNSARWPMG